MIQQHHPSLEICSNSAELKGRVAENGASAINSSYDVIAALGLGIARPFLLLASVSIRLKSDPIIT